MGNERVVVGYVELTEEETERLLNEVRKDRDITTVEELQQIMDNYDSRLLEPEREGPLPEEMAGEETPGVSFVDQEMIEIFPKRVDGNKHYRIQSSKK